MKGLVVLLSCLLGLLTGCSGLPQPREMGDMALLRTMGVDGVPGQLRVTAATGPRAKGIQGEQQPALILSEEGASLSGASLALQSSGDHYVFFGYVDQLLVGEELAREDLRPVLDYFARDRELGLGAQLWMVREGSAEDAVGSGGDAGVEERLSTLRTDGELGAAPTVRTAGEVYTDLLERGAAWLPALRVPEEGPLAEAGYAVLKDTALAGWLEGEAARGLELLTGQVRQDILDLSAGEQRIAVWVSGASTRCRLVHGEDGSAALTLRCRVHAQIAEYERPLSQQEREQLRGQVEERERARLEEVLERLQAWGADCAGLGPRAGLGCPGRWQELRQDWSTRFETIPVIVEVEVELPEQRVG